MSVKVIGKDVKEIEFGELKRYDIDEIVFEDPSNWYLCYDKQKLENMVEYCQSSGHGEISGSMIRTVGAGEIPMDFSLDGKANKSIVDKYNSECPDYVRITVSFRKFVKED